MTALSEFISFCYRVFVACVELTIDALVLPFFLAALLMPWRMPFLVYGLCTKGWPVSPDDFEGCSSRENYRITAVGLIEGLTLTITPIVALSGLRTAKLLERIKKHMRNDMDMDFMSNFPLLVAVWEQPDHKMHFFFTLVDRRNHSAPDMLIVSNCHKNILTCVDDRGCARAQSVLLV